MKISQTTGDSTIAVEHTEDRSGIVIQKNDESPITLSEADARRLTGILLSFYPELQWEKEDDGVDLSDDEAHL